MRVVFMGTPDFAVPSLSEILAAGHEVVCVYTQPPRRAGRGKHVHKSPVHQFADIMGVPVRTPESFRKPSVIDGLKALNVDVACVVAYGQILPVRALAAPRYGCLNLHGSRLPRWRGAAPIQRAVMAGDRQTAAQIIQMEKGLDTGPILLSENIDITPEDTAGSLHDKMARVGAGLWPRALAALARDALTPTMQSGEASYARKIEKSETKINWAQPAQHVRNHIRGLSPFPGAWCELPLSQDPQGKTVRCKIHAAHVENASGKPGEILDDALLIACADRAIRLLRVQPAGKGEMDADDYVRGRPCPVGAIVA
ncbi:MAG TPA: methionyl-tRNA formyltransferase [Hellea balneolensis]|uniref:Methionyl-tRNA formyltransferase n=1 Tax=Hellea balneolensis TaxID=287478 RepID=A0A7C3G5I4_9PROT|nr:methionyl-tRNA formyltransferase [Hellea balneolensis]